jgi:hypothetical protein
MNVYSRPLSFQVPDWCFSADAHRARCLQQGYDAQRLLDEHLRGFPAGPHSIKPIRKPSTPLDTLADLA